MTVGGALLPKALGFSGLTRAGIATSFASATATSITTSGYATSGDRGAGCVYVKGTAAGPGAVQDALGAYWQMPAGKPLDITCFGAKMDGRTDDSAAVNRAMAAAATSGASQVTFPAGSTILGGVNLPANVRVSGAGPNATAVFASSPTATVFAVNLTGSDGWSNTVIENLGFYSADGGASPQTGGAYIALTNCNKCAVHSWRMSNAFVGIAVSGNAALAWIDHGNSVGAVQYHITIGGGSDHFIASVVTQPSGTRQSVCGLHISQSLGTLVTDSDFVGSGHGTCLQPRAGQAVKWMFFQNTALGDSGSGTGLFINPGDGGVVYGVSATNAWTASNAQSGVATICTTGGVIDGVSLVNHRSLVNGEDGITFGCGANLRVSESTIVGNSNTSNGGKAGIRSGIHLAAGLSHVWLTNNMMGPMFGYPVTQKYSIDIAAGAGGYFTITGNDGTGGTTSRTTVHNLATGPNQNVANNWQ